MHAYQTNKVTRKERTSEFRELVETEWQAMYLEFIKPYIAKPTFNWYTFSENLNINPQFIFDNPLFPWKLDRVCKRSDIPIETIIYRYGHLGENVWINLMRRNDMTIEFIDTHPEYPWPYSHSYLLNAVTIDFLKKHESKVEFWNQLHVCTTYTVKEFITAFPNHVDEAVIMYYTGMDSSQVMQTADELVNALFQTRSCKNISNMVDKYPNAKWDWVEISFNKHVTVQFIKKYQKKIKWEYLTSVIDKKIIKANPKLPWNYKLFHVRMDISRAELLEHIMDYTDAIEFGKHPEIRFRDFLNHGIITFDICSITRNTFDGERRDFIERQYREYLAAYRIQQYYNLVKTAPVYEMCRKRIDLDYEREFN